MHANVAGGHRQRRDGLADDADDLRRIGFQFTAHDLPRQCHGQGEQLTLHFGVEGVERFRQVVEHAREPVDLRLHFGAPRAASLFQSLLEGLFVRFGLQIGKTADRRHFMLRSRALHVGHRPQCDSRAGL